MVEALAQSPWYRFGDSEVEEQFEREHLQGANKVYLPPDEMIARTDRVMRLLHAVRETDMAAWVRIVIETLAQYN